MHFIVHLLTLAEGYKNTNLNAEETSSGRTVSENDMFGARRAFNLQFSTDSWVKMEFPRTSRRDVSKISLVMLVLCLPRASCSLLSVGCVLWVDADGEWGHGPANSLFRVFLPEGD